MTDDPQLTPEERDAIFARVHAHQAARSDDIDRIAQDAISGGVGIGMTGPDGAIRHINAQDIIENREKAHGNYLHQATMAQAQKKLLRDSPGWHHLSPEQRESLDMVCVKISRIMNGNPNEPDHWLDMAGYATLVHNILTKGTHL